MDYEYNNVEPWASQIIREPLQQIELFPLNKMDYEYNDSGNLLIIDDNNVERLASQIIDPLQQID